MPDGPVTVFLDALGAACARRFGAPTQIRDAQRVTGGASRETWTFEASTPAGVRALVLRRDPVRAAGQPASPLRPSDSLIDRAGEFAVIALAREAGVPSPDAVFRLDPADGLGEGYVMSREPGVAIARKLLRDAEYAQARPKIVGQLGAALAKLHAIDPARLPRMPALGPQAQIARFRKFLDSIGEPHPVFELAMGWLERRLPPPAAPRLVHGDFRTGNFLADASGVTAILDWELAHLGDPMEDLGWLCVKSWRFGAIDNPVGGFGARETLFAAYEAAGGAPVDPVRVHFWEVFGTLHWGVICLGQAWKHLAGLERSVELASIGRRAAETELDLLQLLRAE
jgi:aminoglycoside phosphotransferase (APT) family kinase protein